MKAYDKKMDIIHTAIRAPGFTKELMGYDIWVTLCGVTLSGPTPTADTDPRYVVSNDVNITCIGCMGWLSP